MANNFLLDDIFSRAFLASFENTLALSKSSNTSYNQAFVTPRGPALRIPKPVRYTTSSGAAFAAQDMVMQEDTLTLVSQEHVDIVISSQEMTLEAEELAKRYFVPAGATLANKVELDGLTAGLNTCYFAGGTAGTAVNSFQTVDAAASKLKRVGVMPDYLTMNSHDSVTLRASLQNSFNTPLNTDISQKAMIGSLAGIGDVMQSPFPIQHTVGNYTGSTPLVNGATQTGAALVTDGWTNSTLVLTKGDLITLAGVSSVNPLSQSSTGDLQTFLVTADVTSDGTGNATIPISPSILPTTAQKTVTASPADNAVISVVSGASEAVINNSFLYHRDAFCLGFTDLVTPMDTTEHRVITSKNSPVRARMVGKYDIDTDQNKLRIDIFYGWLFNPQYGLRLQGQAV